MTSQKCEVFSSWSPVAALLLALLPSLLLADFDGDGLLDVAGVDGFTASIPVLLGNGDGTLGAAALFGGGFADSAVAVDFGKFAPELVISTPEQVVVVKNATRSER